jgi:hypothetical protein
MTNKYEIINDNGDVYAEGNTKTECINNFNEYMDYCMDDWKYWEEGDFGLPYNNPDHPRAFDPMAFDIIEK